MTIIPDFAHRPNGVEATLLTLLARWPARRIVACFEPRSNAAVTSIFQDCSADALSVADEVLLGTAHRAEKIPPENRIDTQGMVERIEGAGKRGRAFARNQELADFLATKIDGKMAALVVFFSNSSFGGVIESFAALPKDMNEFPA